MRVLGVDPGTRLCGWGVVERQGSRLVHHGHGTIRLGDGDLDGRLVKLERALLEVIEEMAPEGAGVESMFFGKNAQSAVKLAHARGVVLLVLKRAGLAVGEYPPARVKSAVAASGQADKSQVARIVERMLMVPQRIEPDAADALAIAITHTSAVAFSAASRQAPGARQTSGSRSVGRSVIDAGKTTRRTRSS